MGPSCRAFDWARRQLAGIPLRRFSASEGVPILREQVSTGSSSKKSRRWKLNTDKTPDMIYAYRRKRKTDSNPGNGPERWKFHINAPQTQEKQGITSNTYSNSANAFVDQPAAYDEITCPLPHWKWKNKHCEQWLTQILRDVQNADMKPRARVDEDVSNIKKKRTYHLRGTSLFGLIGRDQWVKYLGCGPGNFVYEMMLKVQSSHDVLRLCGWDDEGARQKCVETATWETKQQEGKVIPEHHSTFCRCAMDCSPKAQSLTPSSRRSVIE
ncbi:hypothetical protein BP5796_03013 [Coleophoma crateriformis]|uniref:Uncharacterized protein n=1 Tax=Coleophoma crateriformis TaxID=565419 RepID=A0A3D8SLU8_9HELO|nr:hypothetical protein BP5796_03013 [Coleophoma crateriformis]